MNPFTIAVRSPTGSAWMATAIGIIGAGEIYFEQQKVAVANFFGKPFADSELTPVIAACGLFALASLAYLITLYARPGTLTIADDKLTRQRLELLSWRRYEGPLAEWQVRIVFFNESERAIGNFKRIELHGPGLREVLLFSDVRKGEELCKTLQESGDKFKKFDVVLKQPSDLPSDN